MDEIRRRITEKYDEYEDIRNRHYHKFVQARDQKDDRKAEEYYRQVLYADGVLQGLNTVYYIITGGYLGPDDKSEEYGEGEDSE